MQLLMMVDTRGDEHVAWKEAWNEIEYCEADRKRHEVRIYFYEDMNKMRAEAVKEDAPAKEVEKHKSEKRHVSIGIKDKKKLEEVYQQVSDCLSYIKRVGIEVLTIYLACCTAPSTFRQDGLWRRGALVGAHG